MHASFNTSLVHFAIWQATHIAAWDDEAPLMSVEWPPKDEHLLEKALPDGEVRHQPLPPLRQPTMQLVPVLMCVLICAEFLVRTRGFRQGQDAALTSI